MINISAKAKKFATSLDFYVEAGKMEVEQAGATVDIDTIEISEENSDLLVIYELLESGHAGLHLSPEYVEGLPEVITNTRQLTKTVEHIINNYGDRCKD